jgi:hypothetical protein
MVPGVLVEMMGQPLHLKVLAAYRHRRLHRKLGKGKISWYKLVNSVLIICMVSGRLCYTYEGEGTCIAQMTCLLELVLERQRQREQVGLLR